MSKWTLRPQRTTFRVGNPSAASRAKRMVRRHGNEFHGAGVQDAVRDLTDLERFAWASQAARDGVAAMMVAFKGSYEWCLETPPGETAHGLTVVGWHDTAGRVFCPEHREPGYAPLTAAGVPVDADCHECGAKLGAVPDRVCVCTHPYSKHNVHGLCIAIPGVLGCGCLGWSEAGPPAVAPAECPDCTHPHVQGQSCTALMAAGTDCGCTG